MEEEGCWPSAQVFFYAELSRSSFAWEESQICEREKKPSVDSYNKLISRGEASWIVDTVRRSIYVTRPPPCVCVRVYWPPDIITCHIGCRMTWCLFTSIITSDDSGEFSPEFGFVSVWLCVCLPVKNKAVNINIMTLLLQFCGSKVQLEITLNKITIKENSIWLRFLNKETFVKYLYIVKI